MYYNKQTGELNIKAIVTTVVSFLVALIILTGSFRTVGAGHVGVITRLGAVNRVANPGLVWKFPLIENLVSMETRIQKEQVSAGAASKDLQEVSASIAINYHLDAPRAVEVYQNVGVEYSDRLIHPAMQEAFKATTAKYTAEQLITQRESVKKEAIEQIRERLHSNHIIVDDFNIVNFDFSKEFNSAIEAKQVAQQNVEKEKQTLASIEIQAEQARQQAKGQADAQKLLKDAGSLSPEYLNYLAVSKWDGKLPNVTGGATPFVNIPQ